MLPMCLYRRHDLAFFDRGRSGELQSRLSSDCSSLQKLVVGDLVSALRASFLLLGSTVPAAVTTIVT